jgi:glycerol-3-phosphate dehydrogenase
VQLLPDARLVALNAVDAAARGATIRTYTACAGLQADGAGWRVRLESRDGDAETVHARAVVNAAGPWADRFLRGQAGRDNVRKLRLVKGSHIVVPRLFEHDHAYILQNADGRIIFAVPYERTFTLIGTTDVEHREGLDHVKIGDDEVRYLCAQASHYFKQPVRAADVLWTYSGVRPLLDDEAGNAAAVTRDYRLELHRDVPPMLTVWGGKITTYRKLAEEAAGIVADALGRAGRPWTAHAHLPGGDLSAFIGAAQAPDADFARFLGVLEQRHPWLPAPMRHRMARAYGSRIADLLGEARCLADLGAMLAPGVRARELDYLRKTEWARTGGDVLWRRSKLGLHLDAAQRAAIDAWMACRSDPAGQAIQTAFES